MHRALLFLLGACLTVGHAEPQPPDGVAAIVNKDTITWAQVNEALSPVHDRDQTVDPATLRRRSLTVINELIDRQLILQEFRKPNMQCGPSMEPILDRHVQSVIREQFGGDAGAFERTLQAGGLTIEKFRKMEHEKIIIHAWSSQVSRSAKLVPITDERIREYSERHQGYDKPFAEVREEIVKALTEEDRQKARQEWLAKLRRKAYIRIN